MPARVMRMKGQMRKGERPGVGFGGPELKVLRLLFGRAWGDVRRGEEEKKVWRFLEELIEGLER